MCDMYFQASKDHYCMMLFIKAFIIQFFVIPKYKLHILKSNFTKHIQLKKLSEDVKINTYNKKSVQISLWRYCVDENEHQSENNDVI